MLVTVGLWALILPGLILGSAPSVFLYLLAFSIPWFVMNQRGIATAVAGGLATVMIIGFGVPALLNLPTVYREVEAKSREARPATKAAGTRIIGLQPARDSVADTCSDLCQTLLYNGAVQRVVLLRTNSDGSASPSHLSFRVERLPRCLETNPKFLDDSDSWLIAKDLSKTFEAVRLRIAGGECLIQDKEWAGTPDLILQRVVEDVGHPPAPLSLEPGEVHIDGLQLVVQGKIVARESHILARRLAYPLVLLPQGLVTSAWFEWNRLQAQYREPTGARPFLERFTELDLRPPTGLDSKSIAERIDEALADPSVPATDGAFGLVGDYFDSLPQDHVSETDVRRLARLISDPRQSSDPRLYLPTHKLDAAQRLELRNPILDRMWEFGQLNQWELYHKLSRSLDSMPAGAFRDADPRVERLLSTPEFRRNAPVLAKRLADRGPGEAERLLSLLREGFAGPRTEGNSDFKEAALHGICRLGLSAIPQGKPILEALRSLAASGAVWPNMQESELWRATLISVGASANEFGIPASRSLPIDQYRRSLRALAANGCENAR